MQDFQENSPGGGGGGNSPGADAGVFFPELDPVDSMFNALAASPQSSVAPLPPTPPPAHLLSPRNTARPSSSPHPSPAARRGCFGPRVNGYAYPLPRRARDEPFAGTTRGRLGGASARGLAARGSASVPARLLQDPEVPALIELPGTLHGFGGVGGGSLSSGGLGSTAAARAPPAAATAAVAAVGMNPGALLAGVDYAAALGGYSTQGTVHFVPRSKREVVPMPTPTTSVCSDWEQVTRLPLKLDSDMQVFQVPEEWAGRFRTARSLEERYDLVEELEGFGKAYVEQMKKERSDAYYQRMHAMRDLPAATKVTIRGRIHSKLNPFVKEKSAEVHKVIRSYLLESIPFPPQ